jgi:hypothetical protein
MVKSQNLHFQFGTPGKGTTQDIPNHIKLIDDAAKISDRYDEIFSSALEESTSGDLGLFIRLREISEYARRLTTMTEQNTEPPRYQ